MKITKVNKKTPNNNLSWPLNSEVVGRANANEEMPNKHVKLIKARVMTKPKANTLDPQGVVVKNNLEKIGINYLDKVSIGRYIEIKLEEGPEEEVKKNVQEAIDKLLYNSIIEDYEVIYE